jgi:hypothetical protein
VSFDVDCSCVWWPQFVSLYMYLTRNEAHINCVTNASVMFSWALFQRLKFAYVCARSQVMFWRLVRVLPMMYWASLHVCRRTVFSVSPFACS